MSNWANKGTINPFLLKAGLGPGSPHCIPGPSHLTCLEKGEHLTCVHSLVLSDSGWQLNNHDLRLCLVPLDAQGLHWEGRTVWVTGAARSSAGGWVKSRLGCESVLT